VNRHRLSLAAAALLLPTLVSTYVVGLVPGVNADEAPTLSGRVVDLSGQPLAEVAVEGVGSNHITGPDGIFRLPIVNPANSHPRFSYIHVDERHRTSSAVTVFLNSYNPDHSQSSDVGDIEMPRLDDVSSVRVVDSDGDPISGAVFSGGEVCDQRDLPDVPGYGPRGEASQRMCWKPSYGDEASNANGVLRLNMPLGMEEAVFDTTGVLIRDNLNQKAFTETLADASYSPADRTYTVTVAEMDVQPTNPPPAPAGVEVTARESLYVRWEHSHPGSPPAGQAPVTGWRVHVTGDRGYEETHTGLEWYRTDFTLHDIAKGETFTVLVAAESDIGPGEYSDPVSATWITAPAQVDRPSVKVKKNKAIVTFVESADSGGLPLRYLVRLNPKGKEFAVPDGATRYVLKRLKPGRYSVAIRYGQVGSKRLALSKNAKFVIRR